ncbi:MAG: carbonic anhydrase family protein [Bacteroidales bacterium]|nr:carbonic anhydrase family protein [Bacteroidales bacterium]
MKTKLFYSTFFIILSFLASCSIFGEKTPTDCTEVHWTHNGEKDGQEEWVDLCTGYSACGGEVQSPINITGAVLGSNLSAIEFNYTTTETEIENNGHTIEFVCNAGNKINIGGTEYELLQFHYHGLSEHTVNSNHYPLEVHFVHKASNGNYAVIGIFFEEGAENTLFAEFLNNFPTEEGTYADTTEIHLFELLPENKSYFYYNGSLTTPPCSEIVNWYVLQTPLTASATQISQFSDILDNNYRNVQNLNGRSIFKYDE